MVVIHRQHHASMCSDPYAHISASFRYRMHGRRAQDASSPFSARCLYKKLIASRLPAHRSLRRQHPTERILLRPGATMRLSAHFYHLVPLCLAYAASDSVAPPKLQLSSRRSPRGFSHAVRRRALPPFNEPLNDAFNGTDLQYVHCFLCPFCISALMAT